MIQLTKMLDRFFLSSTDIYVVIDRLLLHVKNQSGSLWETTRENTKYSFKGVLGLN